MTKFAFKSLCIALCVSPLLVFAAEPMSGKALVDAVRAQVNQDEQVDRARVQTAYQDKAQLQAAVKKAKAKLARLEAEQAALSQTIEANEQQLAEQGRALQIATDSLGEVQGHLQSQAQESARLANQSQVVSPAFTALVRQLSDSQSLPSQQHLSQYWLGLVEALVASEQIQQIEQTVIGLNGEEHSQPVWQIGEFGRISKGQYLNAQTNAVYAQQPDDLDLAERYSGQSGQWLSLDPTRGSVLAMQARLPTLSERIQQGGTVGWVILTLLSVGLVIAAVRLSYLYQVTRKMKAQRGQPPQADNLLGRLQLAYASQSQSDLETLQLKLEEQVLRDMPLLERGIPMLKLLAAIAPMLGLLGTVSGMIATFQAITLTGSSDPTTLAGGISMALVTTVLGLVAAIPLLLLHNLAQSKSQAVITQLETEIASLLANHIERHQGVSAVAVHHESECVHAH
ncbi:Tol-Pal system protein TolQ [Vibrio stylophorae]|uniref:Tol-Pal system protein TolQ n=1 Tax=Vibrio stylophorae TaxID=659351 RepID=A0ABM8ZTR2_9VIBR|nr:MotA/TolQ/ExbB proton channel family protein [Vibrio stylophorae]CAH0533332.1 Tol-Pal system protein TolQ [Vibrio stylophorae]